MKNDLIAKEVYENLPELFRDITTPFSGREKDIVLLSALGAVSSCLPNVFGEYDGDIVYPNLYALIIAPPASGKGVMNFSRILIESINSKIYKDNKIAREQHRSNSKNDEQKEYPPLEVKIIPGNTSSAGIYALMNDCKDGTIIFESEADTLSMMFKQDWGNFSDVLRKAYHHETLSINRRIEGFSFVIKEPKLSMVISGTVDQLQPLLQSKDNGLFSRFIFYYFDEIALFKRVFDPITATYRPTAQTASEAIFKNYYTLLELDRGLSFSYSGQQYEKFYHEFTQMHELILKELDKNLLSSLNRLGIIMFRIAMILTCIRKINEITSLPSLVCEDIDFDNALKLTKTLFYHAVEVNDLLTDGFLPEQEEKLLFSLPEYFSRQAALIAAQELKMPTRTLDDKLRQWRKKKAIIKVDHGRYKRILI